LAEKLEARQVEQQEAAAALEKKEAEEALLKVATVEEIQEEPALIADADQPGEPEKRVHSPARKSSRRRSAPSNYEPQATKKQRKVTEQTRVG
jgi:hypothetical protein